MNTAFTCLFSPVAPNDGSPGKKEKRRSVTQRTLELPSFCHNRKRFLLSLRTLGVEPKIHLPQWKLYIGRYLLPPSVILGTHDWALAQGVGPHSPNRFCASNHGCTIHGPEGLFIEAGMAPPFPTKLFIFSFSHSAFLGAREGHTTLRGSHAFAASPLVNKMPVSRTYLLLTFPSPAWEK